MLCSLTHWCPDIPDHLKFQSLIYGQKLLLAMVVQKISSTLGKESDRQYLRVWESQAQAQNHGRSLLYFASARPHPTYIEIPSIYFHSFGADAQHLCLT